MERVAIQLPYIYRTTEKGRGRDGKIRVRDVKSLGKASGTIPVLMCEDAPVVAKWTVESLTRDGDRGREAVCEVRMFDGAFYARPKSLYSGQYLNPLLCDQPMTFDGMRTGQENYALVRMIEEVSFPHSRSETAALGNAWLGFHVSGYAAPKGEAILSDRDETHGAVTRLIDSFIAVDDELWRRTLEPKIVFSIWIRDEGVEVRQTVDFGVFRSSSDIWHRVPTEEERPALRSAFGLTEIGSEAIVKAFAIAEDAAGGDADAFRTSLFNFEISDPTLFPFRHADDMVRRTADAVVESVRANVGTASMALVKMWFTLKDELVNGATPDALRTSIEAILTRCENEDAVFGDRVVEAVASLRAMDAELAIDPGTGVREPAC